MGPMPVDFAQESELAQQGTVAWKKETALSIKGRNSAIVDGGAGGEYLPPLVAIGSIHNSAILVLNSCVLPLCLLYPVSRDHCVHCALTFTLCSLCPLRPRTTVLCLCPLNHVLCFSVVSTVLLCPL